MILLDTLNPPAPEELVADCRAAGAAGCWVYAARRDAGGRDIGIGTWTAAHVDHLHEADLLAPAIIVPGSAPPAPDELLVGVKVLCCDPVVAWDIETFSLPPPAWLGGAIDRTLARGWRPLRYGDLVVLAAYPPAAGDWLSHGRIPVRAAAYLPVPALPQDLVADQYAVGVAIGSDIYDVSVVDPVLVPPHSVPLEEPMRLVAIGAQQHLVGVDSTGAVQHWWCEPADGVPWTANPPGISGLQPYAPLEATVLAAPTGPGLQLHLAAPTRDGHLVHAYQAEGSPTWTVETL